jgi:hypothetical protein
MALDYITNPTGIFYRGGKLIKYIDAHAVDALTTLPADLIAISTPFGSANLTGEIAGLTGDYSGFQGNAVALRQKLAGYWSNILTDRATVLEQLRISSGDLEHVLAELPRQMIADSQTVNASVSALGTVTAAAGNVGNGTVLLTRILDGITPPVQDGQASLLYAGLNSELLVPAETMSFTCVRDSGRDGVSEGSEEFAWDGGVPDQLFGYFTEGNGPGPNLTAAGSSTLIPGTFETFTVATVPDGWTSVTGASQTSKETATVYRGTGALKFAGNGATGFEINYAMPAGLLKARKMYCLTLRMRASTAAPAVGDFSAGFAGTGYSPAGTETISVPNAYTLYNAFILMPSVFPSDFRAFVKITGNLDNTVNVFTDDVYLSEVRYHGGVGAVVVPGSTRFAANDRFTAANTNTEGVFQRFFRRFYRMQLPSNNAAGETILDSLAT